MESFSKESVRMAAESVLYLAEGTRGTDLSEELPEREDDREETRPRFDKQAPRD